MYPYQMIQQPQQIQSYVTVKSEQEAINYPVGYGNTVVFRDESKPFLYLKQMGYSNFDKPIFERYKRIDDATPEATEDWKSAIGDINTQIDKLRSDIDFLKDRKKRREENEHNSNGKSVQSKPYGDVISKI